MASRPVKILHLSDVHFGRDHRFQKAGTALPAASTDALIDTILHDASLSTTKFDAVVVSGDLTSTGKRPEFEEAAAFLRDLLKHFGLSREQLIVVPGNHDVLWGKEENVVSHAEFESFMSRVFSSPVQDLEICSSKIGSIYMLGLDLTRLESPQLGGIGFIGKDQLRKAEQKLKDKGAEATCRILVVHHHLLPVSWCEAPPDGKPTSVTLDAPALLAWAQEHRFAMILHGHQHQPFLATFSFADRVGGPLVICGGPSAGANSKSLPPQGRNGFQTILIDGRRISVTVHLLNEANEYKESRTTDLLQEPTGVFATSALPSRQVSREATPSELRSLCRLALTRTLDVVTESYGPRGGLRGVLDNAGAGQIRDGLSIVNSIRPADPLQARFISSLGSLLREVTNQIGDGRKTATLICARTVLLALDAIDEGARDDLVAEGLLSAGRIAADKARQAAHRVLNQQQILRIARTATAGNDEVAGTVVDALLAVGKDGVVVVDRGRVTAKAPFELIRREGARFAFRSPAWLTELVGDAALANAMVVVYTGQVLGQQVIPLLELAFRHKQPLLLLCAKIDDDCQAIIGTNYHEGVIKCIVVQSGESFRSRDEFHDVAALTGARFIDAESGETLADLNKDHVGFAGSVSFDDGELVINGTTTARSVVDRYVSRLRRAHEKSSSEYDKEKIETRIARLISTIVEIRVGGQSEQDGRILANITSDALHAARMAIQSGYISGGGTGYLRCSQAIEASLSALPGDSAEGARSFMRGLEEPIRILMRDNPRVLAEVRKPSSSDEVAYDVTNGRLEPVTESGPIDPAGTVERIITLAADAAARIVRVRSWEVPGEIDPVAEIDGEPADA